MFHVSFGSLHSIAKQWSMICDSYQSFAEQTAHNMNLYINKTLHNNRQAETRNFKIQRVRPDRHFWQNCLAPTLEIMSVMAHY